MNQAKTAYKKVFGAWSNGELAHALELCRELVSNFPDYEIGSLLCGIILYELARYDEAEHILHKAIDDMPPEHLSHGYMHLGHLCAKRGDNDNAVHWYRKAIELEPKNAGLHIFLGAVLARSGDLAGAEAPLRTATRCSKGPIDEAYLNLGNVLRAQERYAEALECYKSALELTPDYPEARTGRSDMEKALRFLGAASP